MNVIDLDRPAPVSVPPTRRSYLIVASALVIGGVLGACAVLGWNARSQAAARDRQVSVFVFADASPFVDGDPTDRVLRNGRVEIGRASCRERV